MTSDEILDALARDDWVSAMKEVLKEPVWKARRKAYERHCRDEKARAKEAERARKEAEKVEERQRKDMAKLRELEARKRERERTKALRDAAKLSKVAEAAAARAAKTAKTIGRAGRVARVRVAAATAAVMEAHRDREPSDVQGASDTTVASRPRPKPRPIRRIPAASPDQHPADSADHEKLTVNNEGSGVEGDRSGVEEDLVEGVLARPETRKRPIQRGMQVEMADMGPVRRSQRQKDGLR